MEYGKSLKSSSCKSGGVVELDPWQIIRIRKQEDSKIPHGEQDRKKNLILLYESEKEQYFLETLDKNFSVPSQDLQSIIQTLLQQFQHENLNVEEEWVTKWLREWIQSEKEVTQSDIPIEIKQAKDWDKGWFPLLILKRNQTSNTSSFTELIASYLSTEFIFIELNPTKTLVLVINDSLQFESGQRKELDEFAIGLYEMLQSEWNEEVKVAIHEPVSSIEDLLQYSRQLLSDQEWIECFWEQVAVISPWNHVLERFISKIPKEELIQLQNLQWKLDQEVQNTMQVFMKENLNMSETARRLYVHRNTLQYRIDKVKQQTGLDVKQFEDAMVYKLVSLIQQWLVHIAQKS